MTVESFIEGYRQCGWALALAPVRRTRPDRGVFRKERAGVLTEVLLIEGLNHADGDAVADVESHQIHADH